MYEFECLVQQTEYIVKKHSITKRGLWRMIDIRFDIMASLIRGKCVTIIKNLLSYEKNQHLHIPRCRSWGGQIKETDLEIAIKFTKSNYHEDTIIIRCLLNYYSDNAVKS